MARRDKRGRLVCECGGYWFPHRKGGGACDHSIRRDIHLAIRFKCKEALTEALIAFALTYPHKVAPATTCPF